MGRTISRSWLYHQSWTIDGKISCVWSDSWSYPLTIGRAFSRRTLCNWTCTYARLGPTGCSICEDLCTTRRAVLLSYDHSHDLSCDWHQQVAKPIAACDQNSVTHQTFTIGCLYFKSTEIPRPKNRTIWCDYCIALVFIISDIFMIPWILPISNMNIWHTARLIKKNFQKCIFTVILFIGRSLGRISFWQGNK